MFTEISCSEPVIRVANRIYQLTTRITGWEQDISANNLYYGLQTVYFSKQIVNKISLLTDQVVKTEFWHLSVKTKHLDCEQDI